LQYLDPNELAEYNVASGSALPGSPEHTPAPGSPERTGSPQRTPPGSPPADDVDENDGDSDGDELEEQDVEDLAATIHVEDLQITHQFIQIIKAASFGDEHDKMDPYYLERMHNPPNEALVLDDPDVKLSIQNFLAVSNASEMTYESIRKNILKRYPDSQMLSLHQVERKIADLSGIVPIVHDMCPNSCMAYTGPWLHFEQCPICGEGRYDQYRSTRDKRVAKQTFYTIPIGPQLQALWRSPEGARQMKYRRTRTDEILQGLQENHGNIQVYDDILCGTDYLNAVRNGDIGPDDMVLLFSTDGARLYQNKQSDCWISIWIIVDHPPDLRYKKKTVAPAFFVPGPNKMKNSESFMFLTWHHLAALQKEGLQIWDADSDRQFISRLFLFLGCADAPGLAMMSGFVGHHGRYGCRIYCPLPGRHKKGGGHYYPVLREPIGGSGVGSNHPDVRINQITGSSVERYEENLDRVMNSRNANFEDIRLVTGISKPSLISALHRRLPLPRNFTIDLMHVTSLNMSDLLMKLYRGRFDVGAGDKKRYWDWAVLKGRVWIRHGKAVASMTKYLPGSFDRPPRNPAKKMNSGYKAWEYVLYLYGLCPAMLRGILPDKYWKHFCKLVYGVRVVSQRRITAEHLRKAHRALLEHVDEFEILYYQRLHSRLHFIRPVLHTLCHLASEAVRVGPGSYLSQWTIERTIGNLGEEVKQPSNPYKNFSERRLRRAQVNALKAMIPTLEPDKDRLPRGSIDLNDGYVLLRAKQRTAALVTPMEAEATNTYLRNLEFDTRDPANLKVTRWARLRLPNGQNARSLWKEQLQQPDRIRTSRNVKVFRFETP
jgi:hypothetical protein